MSVLHNIFRKMDTLVISALGMITALAWNTAFQNFFDSRPLLKKYGPWVYAIVITIITILCVSILERMRKVDITHIKKSLNVIEEESKQ